MTYEINLEWYEDVVCLMGRLHTVYACKRTYGDALNYLLREANEYTKKASISKDGIVLFTLENKFDPNP